MSVEYKTKVCGDCKLRKNIDEFYKDKLGTQGIRSKCQACFSISSKKWRSTEKYRKSVRGRYLAYAYGITEAEYADQLAKQNSGCALCGAFNQIKKRLAVDHDHNCPNHASGGKKACRQCVRGILCQLCNPLLTQLERNPVLQNDYVRAYLAQRPFRNPAETTKQ